MSEEVVLNITASLRYKAMEVNNVKTFGCQCRDHLIYYLLGITICDVVLDCLRYNHDRNASDLLFIEFN